MEVVLAVMLTARAAEGLGGTPEMVVLGQPHTETPDHPGLAVEVVGVPCPPMVFQTGLLVLAAVGLACSAKAPTEPVTQTNHLTGLAGAAVPAAAMVTHPCKTTIPAFSAAVASPEVAQAGLAIRTARTQMGLGAQCASCGRAQLANSLQLT